MTRPMRLFNQSADIYTCRVFNELLNYLKREINMPNIVPSASTNVVASNTAITTSGLNLKNQGTHLVFAVMTVRQVEGSLVILTDKSQPGPLSWMSFR